MPSRANIERVTKRKFNWQIMVRLSTAGGGDKAIQLGGGNGDGGDRVIPLRGDYGGGGDKAI